MALENKLWTERYRPKTVGEYVFVDDHQREIVQGWLNEGSIPNLLLSGDAGVGKTTLAKVLINELNVEDFDVLTINASRENGVDVIRDKIVGFVQTMPFGRFKVVLLDEADYLTPNGQAMLRNDMEAYHTTVRWILTCNYPHRIIPALKSRTHNFHIAKTDRVEFTARAATVLMNEGVQFDLDTLDAYVGACYPDMRKTLNQLQVNSGGGVLKPPQADDSSDGALIEAAQHFKAGRITEGRGLLMHFLATNPSRIEDIYRFMYQNLHLWSDTNTGRDAAIVVIRNGLANLSLVGIPEISVAATLVELSNLE